MGSFDVACAISGITIHWGDPAVFIPLAIKDKENMEYSKRSGIISNDGPFSLFVPVYLPLAGLYSDYGRLDDPRKTNYWDFVAENGGIVPSQLFDDDATFDAGMWVHADVYDALACSLLVGESSAREPATQAPPTNLALKTIGFEYVRDVTESRQAGAAQYNEKIGEIYTYPGFEEKFYILSRGMYLDVCDPATQTKFEGELAYGMYSVEAVIETLNKSFPGINIEPGRLADTRRSDWQMESIHENVAELKEVSASARLFESWYGVFGSLRVSAPYHKDDTMRAVSDACWLGPAWRYVDRSINLPLDHITFKQFETRKCDTEIANFMTFLQNLAHINRLLTPSWCGLQHGNDAATYDFHQIVTSVIYDRET